jgi:hypothetical protein
MRTSTRIVLTLAALLPLQLGAFGEPPETDAPGGDLLRGPTVPEPRVRTLVNVDAAGNLVRLQERPEEAALGLLVLEPERREQAREKASARRLALGMLLVENIDLVRDATDARAAGENETARAVYRKIYDQFDPDHARDPLLDDFAEVLTPAQIDEMKRLVDEYWSAWLQREMRNDRDDAGARERTERRLAFTLFQQELGEAYNWSLRPFRYKLEALYEITEPTEEQRTHLRDAVLDYIRNSRLEPTPEQRRQVTERIHAILDEEQRLRLFEHVITRLGTGR